MSTDRQYRTTVCDTEALITLQGNDYLDDAVINSFLNCISGDDPVNVHGYRVASTLLYENYDVLQMHGF